MHDPIGAFTRIRELYLSYLDTAFRIEDPDVSEERQKLLRSTGSLCTDPLLEPQPEWAKDERRFQDLVHEQGDQAVLAPLTAETRELFINLIGCGLIRRDPKGQLFRPYTHQLQMLAKGVRDGQAGIVTSGTGSGKTESFLLPVLATILAEAKRDRGGWSAPAQGYLQNSWWRDPHGKPFAVRDSEGVYGLREGIKIRGLEWDGFHRHHQRAGEVRPAAIRALVLYPMNALVEDQMARLRAAIDSNDARDLLAQELQGNRIFFGRYTGQTPGGPCYWRRHERALAGHATGNSTNALKELIPGSSSTQTLSKWKQQVKSSRQRRIEEMLIAYARMEDLQQAVRSQLKLESDQQAGWEQTDEQRETAFAFPSTDGAEMLSRWDMQETPPDILITNISMLNAMLSRSSEQRMLDQTRDWLLSDSRNRFTLVIDELHHQRGSEGTEFIYLLRLLLVRLGLDAPERHQQLRLLASSASLPSEGDGAEQSLDFLRDAFADFGLPLGSERESWRQAIVPGDVVPPPETQGLWSLPADPQQVLMACKQFLKAAGIWDSVDTQENSDALFPLDALDGSKPWQTDLLDALDVQPAADPAKRWLTLAEASGLALVKACRDPEAPDRTRATAISSIARRLWPSHDWDERDVEQVLRLLCAVVGCTGEGASDTGSALPRFRLHTFFKSPEGLYASVVPPSERGDVDVTRWQGPLSLNLSGRRLEQSATSGASQLRRQFELLHCECCGETFLGGIRARGRQEEQVQDQVEELLPHEADTERLPDQPLAERFEELSYEDYAIVWPKDDNSRPEGDPDNSETWLPVWLDPVSGILHRQDPDHQDWQPGYLFQRTSRAEVRGLNNSSSTSHRPCRCPRCKSDYAQRRGFTKSLIQYSPVQSLRPGFSRTTQLLATEIYDVLARGKDHNPKLVSFADSRQTAARTALDVEHLHHRDLLREVLMVTLMEVDAERRRLADGDHPGQRELNELDAGLQALRATGLGEDSPAMRPLLERRQQLAVPLQQQALGVIPFSEILEIDDPSPGDKVRPFLSQLITLGVHPFDDRGQAWVETGTNRRLRWWQLFEKDPHTKGYRWCIPSRAGLTKADFSRVAGDMVRLKLLKALADVVFHKSYFAIEATGLAFPVPLPTPEQLAVDTFDLAELQRAAAWLRIYADDYRYAPCPWETKDAPINTDSLESGRSNISRLLLKFAEKQGGEPIDYLLQAQALLRRYGEHSSPNHDYVELTRIGFQLPADSDPFWRCKNCGRVHLHRGIGACTRCGTTLEDEPSGQRGKLIRSHVFGRRLRRTIDAWSQAGNAGDELFRLRCEELTGQTVDPGSRQREFRGIRLQQDRNHELEPHGIEMLSVTTTMEVGIDIGPLEAVLQANMPPQRFNYQQRVGRAGRRGQSFSFVVTLCRSRSHDLHYFRNPEIITGASPPPPFLVKRLARIAERLLRKDRLIHAFRWIEQRHRAQHGFWAGDLVRPVDVHGDFIPATSITDPALRLQWQGWLKGALEATSDQAARTRAALDRQRQPELADTEKLKLEPVPQLVATIATGAQRIGANTSGLAAHLANEGVLPMYGLPTRVRDLVVGQDSAKRETISLDRDLEVAIYEFAPGNVLVYDKREHRCIGLTPRIGRVGTQLKTLQQYPWDLRLELGCCPVCGAWQDVASERDAAELTCPSCQTTSAVGDWEIRSCLEPAAFRTDFTPSRDLDGLSGSQSHALSADAAPPQAQDWRVWPKSSAFGALEIQLLCNSGCTVYRLNRGPDAKGFQLGWREGVLRRMNANNVLRASDDPALKAQAIDSRLLSGDKIRSILAEPLVEPADPSVIDKVFLVAPRVTDGLYLLSKAVNPQLAIAELGNNLHIPGAPLEQEGTNVPNGVNYWQGVRAAAISATELLIARATRELDVDHRSLEGVEPRPFGTGKTLLPLIQIVDAHVNGAGFSAYLGEGRRSEPPILQYIEQCLLNEAEEWSQGTHQGNCLDSCYDCLKTYENQYFHGLLDWRQALTYLRAFVQPSWLCGLDGDFSWGPLRDWPEHAERAAQLSLDLCGGEKGDLLRTRQSSGLELVAFRLPATGRPQRPWVIVRHPLWRWGLESGSIVLGEPSYSIKKVEHLYMERREAEVTNAGDSVVAYLNWQNSGEPDRPGALLEGSPLLKDIENYNREDCESTVLLHDWLLQLRREQGLPEQPLVEGAEEKENKEPWPLEQLSAQLLAELPEILQSDPLATASDELLAAQQECGSRGMSWRVQRLLAQLLPFHHREAKVAWWAYFDRRSKAELSPEELIDDGEAIAEARWKSVEARASKLTGADYHTFWFDPAQPLKLSAGSGDRGLQLEIPATGLKVSVESLDAERGRVTLKLPWKKRDQRLAAGFSDGIPEGLSSLIKVPADISESLRESLLEQANCWLSGGKGLPKALLQLLERQPVAELAGLNEAICAEPDSVIGRLSAFLAGCGAAALALQGPPGTGKSTVTAEVIAQLVAKGKRVAISSNSHAAINNLLRKAKATCTKQGFPDVVVKCSNSKSEEQLAGSGIPLVPAHALADEMAVVGGTTWMFCRDELSEQFDLLVIDEAGQMSLANLLVMARSAKTILLVGDQQQLAQPTQADHPGDSGLSCLEYLMQGAHVVPADRGVFLATSWRMEPSLTAMVSQLFYDGRLNANPANASNAISWRQPCIGATGEALPQQGLVFEAVEHNDCSVCSEAEIDRIEQLVDALLGSSYCHAAAGQQKRGVLGPEQILVTAPYNVQVNRLQQRLGNKARVGTVDKFQGQEAPVAIHSLTASDGDAAPRGLGFLLEPNRLNVAISRAQCLSIVVGSPGLTTGIANTVQEAEQINRLCRITQPAAHLLR